VRFAHLPPSCAVSLAPSFSPLLVPPCPPPFPYTTLFRSVDEPFAFVVLHPVDHAPHLHVHVGVVGVGRRHRDPVVPLQVLELLSCRGLAELEVLAVPIDPHGAGVWFALGSERGHVTQCGLAQCFLLLLRKTHALPFFRWCVVQLSSTPPHALGHTATRPRTVERYRARSGLSFPFSQGLWCSIDRRCWWDFQDSALVGLAPSSEKIAFLAAGAGASRRKGRWTYGNRNARTRGFLKISHSPRAGELESVHPGKPLDCFPPNAQTGRIRKKGPTYPMNTHRGSPQDRREHAATSST